MLVLSCPVGSGTRVRATEHEPGLVLGVVLDVLGQDGQAVPLGRQPGRDGGLAGGARLAEHPGRVGRGVGRPLLGLGQRPGQVLLALGQRVGVGGHGADVAERRARAGP